MNRTISNIILPLLFLIILGQSSLWACTIFCAKDHNGHVWVGNNEDAVFSFGTKINISPGSDGSLGYIYFDYAYNLFPQGGINEAGLFYDFNSVPPSEIKDIDKKIPYPGESSVDFLYQVLRQCKTVPEVIKLYEKYKLPWMKNGQMHLADKEGNLGIIVADSAWVTRSNYQVSTNYNLCHENKDNKKCWRYPIADRMLQNAEPNFELIRQICDSTHQRKIIRTIYSNLHNLNTGEIRLYYAEDYEHPYITTFDDLMALGDTILTMRDLFPDQPVVRAYNAFKETGFAASLEELNTITDSIELEQKKELLYIGTMYQGQKFVVDDQLISQIIESTNSSLILKAISKRNISRSNKKLAKEKLKFIRSGFDYRIIIGIILFAGVLMIVRYFMKK